MTGITIRRFRPTDVLALHEAAIESLDQLMPWMAWCERDFSLEDSAEWIQFTDEGWTKGESRNFAIVEKDTDRLVGSIWLSRINRKHKFANLGYWVRTSCIGRGIATGAGRLIARFAFSDLGLNRLEILVAVGNRPSERVAEKLGARREGILRQRLHLEGYAKDGVMFGLLAEEFRG